MLLPKTVSDTQKSGIFLKIHLGRQANENATPPPPAGYASVKGR